MKITKKQLREIIKEELLSEKMDSFKALVGAKVKFTQVFRDGTALIKFDNGISLEFTNDGHASLISS